MLSHRGLPSCNPLEEVTLSVAQLSCNVSTQIPGWLMCMNGAEQNELGFFWLMSGWFAVDWQGFNYIRWALCWQGCSRRHPPNVWWWHTCGNNPPPLIQNHLKEVAPNERSPNEEGDTDYLYLVSIYSFNYVVGTKSATILLEVHFIIRSLTSKVNCKLLHVGNCYISLRTF